jgi:hypothetical protein
MSRAGINLPSFVDLTRADVRHVCEQVVLSLKEVHDR